MRRAEHSARVERVRNVLDNRGVDHDDDVVERLAYEGEDALREYLRFVGVAPQDPLGCTAKPDEVYLNEVYTNADEEVDSSLSNGL